MSAPWVVLSVCGILLSVMLAADQPRVEPRVTSVHPSVAQRGGSVPLVVRGAGLAEANAVFLQEAPFTMTVEGHDAEPAPVGPMGKTPKTPIDLLRLRVEIAKDAKPGRYEFRLVTPDGVSNAIPLDVSSDAVQPEPPGPHGAPEQAIALDQLPAVIAGCISKRGETDYFSFEAKAGEPVTFEVFSGVPSGGFDPSITIFEQSGSWFDAKRANRLAFNDEPMWTLGRPTDAQLLHKFEKSGRYLVRVEAFSGLGGPDYTYQLRVRGGESRWDAPAASLDWRERDFARPLAANRLNQLAARGGKAPKEPAVETYRALSADAGETPRFQLPASLEGTLATPGEAHRARFAIDGPRDVAIEVETPAAAPPFFNPVVRLLDATGQEVATNVLAGRGACSGELSKSLQAKTVIPLRNPGEYTVEVREAASDLGGADFRYRVHVRPQIPHVGQVDISEDRLNLAPGSAKTVRVMFDREEDFRGAIAVAADSLPPGVQAYAGADFEPDKDPVPFPGKRERYTPRTERAVVVFTASADAAPMERPHMARLLVLPVADGRPGEPLATKEIPVMVVRKP